MGGSSGGRYVRCDVCEKETFSINLPWHADGKTLAAAREAGWLRTQDGRDFCPKCQTTTEEKLV